MSEVFDVQRNLIELGGGQEAVFTEWGEGEWVSPSAVAQAREAVLRLDGLSPSQVYRRVFFYAEALLGTYGDDYCIRGEIVFVRNNRPIARLPASIGRNLKSGSKAWEKSVASLACATNVPGPDSLQLSLCYKWTGNTSLVYLTPMKVWCQADAAYWSILGVDNRDGTISRVRAWVGILSSNRA